MCVCVCVYIYIYIHTHTHTHKALFVLSLFGSEINVQLCCIISGRELIEIEEFID